MNCEEEREQIIIEMKCLLEKLKSVDEINNAGVNVFSAIGMGNQEIKHSYFLAWLLNPKMPHGLGNVMLKKLIEKLYNCVASNEDCIQQARFNIDCLAQEGFKTIEDFRTFFECDDIVVETERTITTNERRIDVFIESKKAKTLIIIENKVFSGLHTNQLGGYEKEINEKAEYADYKKVWIFLTPKGVLPIEDGIYYDKWCVLGYREIIECIDEILLKLDNKKENAKIRILLEDYREMVDKNVLIGNKELLDVCKQIRRKYKNAMDVLYLYTKNNDKIRECYEKYVLNGDFGYDKVTVCATGTNFDFYDRQAEMLFEEYKEKIQIDKCRYKFRCRINERKDTGILTALAFLEKDENDSWSPAQLKIYENTRDNVTDTRACTLGRKYCTLFSVPLLDEYDVYADFEKTKKKLIKKLDEFRDLVYRVLQFDIRLYDDKEDEEEV